MERMVGLRDECACTVNQYRVAYNIKDLTRSVGLAVWHYNKWAFCFRDYAMCIRSAHD